MSEKIDTKQQVSETDSLAPSACQTQHLPVSKSAKSFFGKIWAGIRYVFHLLFWTLCLVTYLNFLPHIWYFLCHLFRKKQLRKHSYAHGEFVIYSATFSQWFGQLIRSEQANRRCLLKWVQELIPARKIVDLNRSWSNGVSLCALIEALVPDTCPRYDLLKPEARVNNCRLGMKLVQRGLGIIEPMEPEVMADPRRIQDDVMKKYLLSMQYASQTPLEVPEVPVKIPDAGGQIKLEDKAECTANGSGLVLAVVGKRARFNIATQTYKSKHLIVEICGPSGDRLRKKLVDTHGGARGPVRQSSKDEVIEGADVLSFGYQCVKTGSFQVNYTPRVVGIYEISITWGAEHIINSPYNIRATLAKGAEPPPPFKTKTVSFHGDKGPVIPEAVPEEQAENGDQYPSHPGSLVQKGRRQSLVRQSHVTRRGDSSESSGSGTLSAFSSINSSIAASVDKEGTDLQPSASTQSHHQFSRQASSLSATRGSLLSRSSSVMYGTVDGPARTRTKRKVLRRIIKGAGGKEELIHYPQQQEQQKQKNKDTTKMTTGGKSSPRSASPRPQQKSPSPSAAPPNKEKVVNKYGDRMSKIILGKALYEVSKKMIMRSSMDKPDPKLDDKTVKSKSEKPTKTKAAKDVQDKQIAAEPKPKPQTLSPQPKTIRTTTSLSASCNMTLTEPDSKTGNKPLVEVQQVTQEFSPQVSRDSDTSNSEREGPLGQESNEQSTGKRRGSNTQFTSAITPTMAAKTENEIKPLETVDRNGPDGQEKGDEEEPINYKKLTASRSKSWEPKPSGSLVNDKNKKNVLQQHSKENIAPATKLLQGQSENGTSTGKWEGKPKPKTSKSSNGELEKPVTLKVKRLPANRPRADKETQCSAQGIKEETGWVSRRTVFQMKQKKDTDNDSALGESRGSSMLASNTDSRDVDVGSWKSVERDNKPLKVLDELSKSDTFETIPFRPRIPSDSAFLIRSQSRPMTRQATFDSGYSDANSHGIISSRGSRDHSNWNSRTASASSSYSASINNPSVHDPNAHNLIAGSRQRNAQDKPPIVPTIDQPKHTGNLNKANNSGTTETETPKLDGSNLPNVETASSPKLCPQDCLTVGTALMISSTDPTPGGSPLPSQLSTPANSSHSTSPLGDSKVDIFASLDTSNASPIAGLSARDIGEKLVSGDMSLDTLLQSLEHDPDYSTREFLRKFRPASLRDNTMESLQVSYDQSIDQSVLDSEVERLSPRPGSIKSNNSVPLAERCRASGAGLFQGLVNTKNNFQVQTDNAGDGSLGVSIRGPQPHTVVESNVVYTGDDLYEVMYEVNLPGFYVISVKWDDKHIADSPFIIKVTF